MQNDHWTSKHHKSERNWFIEQLQTLAQAKYMRITFLAGDVHCAAVGVLKTRIKGRKNDMPPDQDFRYMLNVVSSELPVPYTCSHWLTVGTQVRS